MISREKPGDEDWIRLDAMKVPFLLNYSQCQLLLGNYYEVIEQCSQVLQREPDNVKALYRRGIANLKAWNPDEAEKDLKVSHLPIDFYFPSKKSITFIWFLESSRAGWHNESNYPSRTAQIGGDSQKEEPK